MQNIEQIYEEYFETIRKYLFCLTRNNDIAEELTQETFYKAIKKIHTYNGECKISVWLCQIAKNLWFDQLKKNKKIQFVDDRDLIDIPIDECVEDKVILNDEKNTIYKQIQMLDKNTRNVMCLKIIGDLSFKEIGIILNKSENWARTIFYRGKKNLKEVCNNERK